ncbi:MAG: hypothetical protein ABFD54_11585 [Armatimonadota bacterium]|nr:hypothetical protein [bacterium]
MNHVRRKQTPWQFEIDGSIRARHIDDTILTLNRHLFNPSGRMVFPYIGTGIVKGKWNADAVLKLFGEHNIEVDFIKRGFYNPPKPDQTTRRPRNFVRPWLKKMVYRCDELFDRLREL